MMPTTVFLITTILLLGGAPAPIWAQAQRLAPFVGTPQVVIERMLELAEPKPGEVLFDLGSGDGRVLITACQKYRVKAVGVEIAPELVAESRRRIEESKLTGRIEIIHGNVLDADLSKANVVFLYLMTDANAKLKPKLEAELKPGARVVSHDFEVPHWVPVVEEEVRAHSRKHKIFLYKVPAKKLDH